MSNGNDRFVYFPEELFWHFSTGIVITAGSVGRVVNQWGDRLTVEVDGVFVHSVPVDLVTEFITS